MAGQAELPRFIAKYDSIKLLIYNGQFWQRTLELQKLLKIFLEVIISSESNQPKLSYLYGWWVWLLQSTELTTSFVETGKIIAILQERFYNSYSPLWAIAYLCDPVAQKRRPVRITADQTRGIGQYLLKWCRVHGENDDHMAYTLYGQLMEMKDGQGVFSDQFAVNAVQNTSIDCITWWEHHFSDGFPTLYALAKFALSISPTSGAAERNWSAFGHIHCKKRNRLRDDKVEMLVFIYWNLQLMNKLSPLLDRPEEQENEEDYDYEDEITDGVDGLGM
jgi:hypothetical protein